MTEEVYYSTYGHRRPRVKRRQIEMSNRNTTASRNKGAQPGRRRRHHQPQTSSYDEANGDKSRTSRDCSGISGKIDSRMQIDRHRSSRSRYSCQSLSRSVSPDQSHEKNRASSLQPRQRRRLSDTSESSDGSRTSARSFRSSRSAKSSRSYNCPPTLTKQLSGFDNIGRRSHCSGSASVSSKRGGSSVARSTTSTLSKKSAKSSALKMTQDAKNYIVEKFANVIPIPVISGQSCKRYSRRKKRGKEDFGTGAKVRGRVYQLEDGSITYFSEDEISDEVSCSSEYQSSEGEDFRSESESQSEDDVESQSDIDAGSEFDDEEECNMTESENDESESEREEEIIPRGEVDARTSPRNFSFHDDFDKNRGEDFDDEREYISGSEEFEESQISMGEKSRQLASLQIENETLRASVKALRSDWEAMMKRMNSIQDNGSVSTDFDDLESRVSTGESINGCLNSINHMKSLAKDKLDKKEASKRSASKKRDSYEACIEDLLCENERLFHNVVTLSEEREEILDEVRCLRETSAKNTNGLLTDEEMAKSHQECIENIAVLLKAIQKLAPSESHRVQAATMGKGIMKLVGKILTQDFQSEGNISGLCEYFGDSDICSETCPEGDKTGENNSDSTALVEGKGEDKCLKDEKKSEDLDTVDEDYGVEEHSVDEVQADENETNENEERSREKDNGEEECAQENKNAVGEEEMVEDGERLPTDETRVDSAEEKIREELLEEEEKKDDHSSDSTFNQNKEKSFSTFESSGGPSVFPKSDYSGESDSDSDYYVEEVFEESVTSINNASSNSLFDASSPSGCSSNRRSTSPSIKHDDDVNFSRASTLSHPRTRSTRSSEMNNDGQLSDILRTNKHRGEARGGRHCSEESGSEGEDSYDSESDCTSFSFEYRKKSFVSDTTDIENPPRGYHLSFYTTSSSEGGEMHVSRRSGSFDSNSSSYYSSAKDTDDEDSFIEEDSHYGPSLASSVSSGMRTSASACSKHQNFLQTLRRNANAMKKARGNREVDNSGDGSDSTHVGGMISQNQRVFVSGEQHCSNKDINSSEKDPTVFTKTKGRGSEECGYQTLTTCSSATDSENATYPSSSSESTKERKGISVTVVHRILHDSSAPKKRVQDTISFFRASFLKHQVDAVLEEQFRESMHQLESMTSVATRRSSNCSKKNKKYQGEYNVQGERHGYGIYISKNGNEYRGEWQHNKRGGLGVVKIGNGDVFEGQFDNNLKNGVGVYHYKDGECDLSHYENDLRVGDGLRWTCNRKQAYLIRDSGLKSISLEEAADRAKDMGVVVAY